MNTAEWIAKRSFRNCHAHGVNSLLLYDDPGGRVRMFVAHPNHTLWKNTIGKGNMSVAFHGHRCDVTLVPYFGMTYNVTPTDEDGFPRVWLYPYRYTSNIDGKGSFASIGSGKSGRIAMEPLTKRLTLRAKDMHTIYVPKGESAAWVVCEGKEDPSYAKSPFVWSNDRDLEHFDWSGLYQPMTADYVQQTLDVCAAIGGPIPC